MARQPADRIPVGILGATGIVGQRLVLMLSDHPWFRVHELVASHASTGRTFQDVVRARAHDSIPAATAVRTLKAPESALQSRMLFSALDAAVAGELEPLYAGRGHLLVSNASAFRAHPHVPLLIPEINPEAIELIDRQSWKRSGGGIVTNPNCCVVGLTLALAPLHNAFGITSVLVSTMQALSGGGHALLSSRDGLGNVIPFIPGEEEKISSEPLKILGAEFPISVATHRVPVIDGHTMAVFVKLRHRASMSCIRRAMSRYVGKPPSSELPSAPMRPLNLVPGPNRPQPNRDAMRGRGMVVSVGNVRQDPVYDARFTVLVHNVVRGAAGAAILNAELLARELLGMSH